MSDWKRLNMEGMAGTNHQNHYDRRPTNPPFCHQFGSIPARSYRPRYLPYNTGRKPQQSQFYFPSVRPQRPSFADRLASSSTLPHISGQTQDLFPPAFFNSQPTPGLKVGNSAEQTSHAPVQMQTTSESINVPSRLQIENPIPKVETVIEGNFASPQVEHKPQPEQQPSATPTNSSVAGPSIGLFANDDIKVEFAFETLSPGASASAPPTTSSTTDGKVQGLAAFDACLNSAPQPTMFPDVPPLLSKRTRTKRATDITPVEKALLLVPLDRGWRREVSYRMTGKTAESGRIADIYYYPPPLPGATPTKLVKLRARTDVQKYLLANSLQPACEGLIAVQHFSFNENIELEHDGEIRRVAREKLHASLF